MIKNVDLSLYLLAMIISKLKHLDIKISGALLEWNHGNYIHESFNMSVDMIFVPLQAGTEVWIMILIGTSGYG